MLPELQELRANLIDNLEDEYLQQVGFAVI
jgi:hypothetical protein